MKNLTENGPTPTVQKRLSNEEIEARRLEVSKALGGIRVNVFCFDENEEHGQVIGFLREPNLQTKTRALDNMGVDNLFSTGKTLLDSLLITEHSDPRITIDDPDFHPYYLGAVTQAVALCRAARSVIKKK